VGLLALCSFGKEESVNNNNNNNPICKAPECQKTSVARATAVNKYSYGHHVDTTACVGLI